MDLSFSLDENENVLLNVAQSTPKKKKPEFICPYCERIYVSKFYYEKHVGSHTSTDNNVTEISLYLDVSTVSFSELNQANTSQATANQKQQSDVVFKVPKPKGKPKNPKRKPNLICTYCLKGYLSTRSFQSHLRSHVIQSAASRYPNKDKLLENADEISSKALAEVSNVARFGQTGTKFNELMGYLATICTTPEWHHFVSTVCEHLICGAIGQKFLLPSALKSSLVHQVECISSDIDLCTSLLSVINVPEDIDENIRHCFLVEFIIKFSLEILGFISATIRSGQTPKVKEINLDEEDRQVIFYIGGSIMRGYLRIAYRQKSSSLWSNISQAIRLKVLREEPTSEGDAAWTSAINRGGLLFITKECQDFFIALAKTVFTCEKRDGSINYDEVLGKVLDSDVSVLWDSVIVNSLPEQTSLNLMYDVVRCFCRTCGRGFAKRRLNFIRDKPVVSMPTRHRVASRKGI